MTNPVTTAIGERLAVRHLVDAGMVVLDRDWQTRTAGGVTVVARDQDVLVLCQILTRTTAATSTPRPETLLPPARARRAATEWLSGTTTRPRAVRVDVVEVYLPRRGRPRVSHLAGPLLPVDPP